MVVDSCRFYLDIKPDVNVSTIFLGNISEWRLMNNRTLNIIVEISELRERSLNQSGWLETLNTGRNSISMKWSIDNIAIDGLGATYLSLTFKVNYLETYNATLFASITDEIEQSFETVAITDDRSI